MTLPPPRRGVGKLLLLVLAFGGASVALGVIGAQMLMPSPCEAPMLMVARGGGTR